MASLPEHVPSSAAAPLVPTLTSNYARLGITPDATFGEIERAYAAKRGSSAATSDVMPKERDVDELELAYKVLSDPDRRELYDLLGDSVLSVTSVILASHTVAMLVLLLRLASRLGVTARYTPCASVSPFFGLLYLGTAFCCLRVDSSISWSWATVLTPLWVLDAAWFSLRGAALFTTKAASEAKTRELYGFLRSLLLLGLQVLIVLRLDGKVSLRLLTVLLPYFVYEVLGVPGAVASGGKAVLHLLLRVTQGLLLAFKADGELGHVSWWLVLLPVWVYVLGQFVQYIQGFSGRPLVAKDIAGLAFMALMVHLPLFLLATRLSGGDQTFSSFYVVLPWLLPVTPFWITLCFTAAKPRHEHGEEIFKHGYRSIE